MLDKNKKYLCETATVQLTGRISVPPSVAGRIVKNDTNAKYEVVLVDAGSILPDPVGLMSVYSPPVA
mgnify:CR=1 FL=1